MFFLENLNNEKKETIESIEQTINTLVSQIDFLSKKTQMDLNKKHNSINYLEYSSTMHHLSKTLGELVFVKQTMVSKDEDYLNRLINGRIR